jgi:hypothetical protein
LSPTTRNLILSNWTILKWTQPSSSPTFTKPGFFSDYENKENNREGFWYKSPKKLDLASSNRNWRSMWSF